MSDENEDLEKRVGKLEDSDLDNRIYNLEQENKDLKKIIQVFFNTLTSSTIDPRIAEKIRNDVLNAFDNEIYLKKENDYHTMHLSNGLKISDNNYYSKKEIKSTVEMMGWKIKGT